MRNRSTSVRWNCWRCSAADRTSGGIAATRTGPNQAPITLVVIGALLLGSATHVDHRPTLNDALTTIVDNSKSVVALDGGSTASGVGVQLLDGSGNTMPFATQKIFTGYNKASGGSYTIPLQARYYRTGNVSPGTANTAMTVTINYQ